MSYNIVLILALALPALVFLFLRVNAAMVFLSVCLGAVLVDHVASEAITMLGLFTPKANQISRMTIELILLLAPAVVTTILAVFSVHGRVKVVLNLIPAAAASMLAVLLVVPLLPRSLMYSLQSQEVWRMLWNAEALVVGAGALVSLFFLWTQRRSFRNPDKHKH